MKVFAISDLHLSFETEKPMDVFGGNWLNYEDKLKENWQNIVGEEDLVLIAGDISWAMQLNETKSDFDFISNLNGKKVIIRGNHDYWWSTISAVRNILPRDMYAIQNDCLRFDNVLLCGTRGWAVPEKGKGQSKEDEKIFEREKIRLDLTLSAMSKERKDGDTVICMMHYPPFNSDYEHSDFMELLQKYNVDIVVFGHIHGITKFDTKMREINGIKYYLSSCDKLANKPIQII